MEMNGVTVINRPAKEVFGFVTDLANDARWRQGVDESNLWEGQTLEVGAVGYTRAGEQQVEWKIISYTPGESVTWEFLSGPFPGQGGYHVTAVGEGTEFTLYAEIEPSGAYRLLGPVFRWIGRRRNQADVEKLRQILEA